MKERYRITHYLPLVSILIVTILGAFIGSYDKPFQMSLLIAAGASYIVWGLVHHYIHQDLSTGIILEYISLVLFGILIVINLI